MKIIKEGKKRITARKVTCPKCECVMEYEKSDLRYDQRDPLPFVTCPNCATYIEVENWKDYE